MESLIQSLLFFGSILLITQGLTTLVWMLYSWNKKESEIAYEKFLNPEYSFTALLPARFEEKVISDTIRSINNINYPNHLKEIIILVRNDDLNTFYKAQQTVTNLQNENIRIVILTDTFPINKPTSLNIGLIEAKNRIITVFDAEDEPNPNIYNIVNTTLISEKVDVVQSGVALMNYKSRWFSTLNVLEYFFWFKSGIHFFNEIGKVSFLGGNTIFIKKNLLKLVGGWDQNNLTEDADLGIRLTAINAKIKMIYDDKYVTKEETPETLESFIKQRTRWGQGFMQIFIKGVWLKLPTFKQRFVAFYMLLAPLFPILLFIYTPFGIWVSIVYKVPVPLAIISYVPFYILFGIICISCVGIYEFTKAHKLKYNWYLPLKVLLTFFPYITILNISAARAILRMIFSLNTWEKTDHLNAHRLKVIPINLNLEK